MKKFTKEITALLTTVAVGISASATIASAEETASTNNTYTPEMVKKYADTVTIGTSGNVNSSVPISQYAVDAPQITTTTIPPLAGTSTSSKTTTSTTTTTRTIGTSTTFTTTTTIPPLAGTSTSSKTTTSTTTTTRTIGTSTTFTTTTTIPPLAGTSTSSKTTTSTSTTTHTIGTSTAYTTTTTIPPLAGASMITTSTTTIPPLAGTSTAVKTTEPIADNVTLYGDANCDDCVDISDVVLLKSWLLNNQRYEVSKQGLANSDVQDTGNGINANDIVAIQRYSLKIIAKLPTE